jgi:hypothetical protein
MTAMHDVMQTRRTTVYAILLMLGFFGSAASASDEEQHHEYPHHHLALFAGGGFERDSHGHEENGYSLGVVYELKFREKWGIGAAVEELSGDDTHRSWAVAIPLSYHPNEKWRFFAGPGLETGEKDKFLMRVGIGYEYSLNERWSASPEFVIDFVEGGAKTYLLGIAIGYGF